MARFQRAINGKRKDAGYAGALCWSTWDEDGIDPPISSTRMAFHIEKNVKMDTSNWNNPTSFIVEEGRVLGESDSPESSTSKISIKDLVDESNTSDISIKDLVDESNTSNISIKDLVDDVLIKIFSYLRVQDIVSKIQHVSVRWKELCLDTRVWNHLTYIPTSEEDELKIASVLVQTKMLYGLELKNKVAGQALQCALWKSGSQLRKLVLHEDTSKNEKLLGKLLPATPKLEHLVLPGNFQYSPESCAAIGDLDYLKVLKVSLLCHMTYLPLHLKFIIEGCPLLEHIDLGCSSSCYSDLKMLLTAKRNTLHTFSLHCRSTDQKCSLSLLSLPLSLKFLHLYLFCDYCSKDDVEFIRNLKNIKELSLQFSNDTHSNLFYCLFSKSKLYPLTVLNIDSCLYFCDQLCQLIILNCPNIKTLSLRKNSNLTNRGFKCLSLLEHLQCLHVQCDNLTDGIMDYFVPCRSHLREISLESCRKLTSKSMKQITKLHNLESLTLSDGCDLSGLQYNLFPLKLKHLKFLKISGSINNDDTLLKKLCCAMPQLLIQC